MPKKSKAAIERTRREVRRHNSCKIATKKKKKDRWPRVKGDQVKIDYDCLKLPLDDGRILKVDIGSDALFELAKELLKSEMRNKLDTSGDWAYKVQAQHAMGCVRCNTVRP